MNKETLSTSEKEVPKHRNALEEKYKSEEKESICLPHAFLIDVTFIKFSGLIRLSLTSVDINIAPAHVPIVGRPLSIIFLIGEKRSSFC